MAAANPGKKTPAAVADDGCADYSVLSPLEHDGVRYEPGATVRLAPEHAAPLLGHTVVPLLAHAENA